MSRFDRIDDDDLFTPEPVRSAPGQPVLAQAPLQPWEWQSADLPTDPRYWLFAIAFQGRDFLVYFTPTAYWLEYNEQIDRHVSGAIGHALPFYLQDNEEMESTFTISGASPTRDDIFRDLLDAGFQHHPSFELFFNDPHLV